MTLFPTSPTLLPMAHDQTRSSASAGSISATYDLLSLPGMIISILADDTSTASTGAGASHLSTHMVVSHPVRLAEPASASMGSTDSSALGTSHGTLILPSGGCASQFRTPFKQPAMIDLASLMMLLGGFVALVVESTGQKKQQNGMPHEKPAK